ncbi:aspartyl-phosphate phosphatase Spo0E family protein [Virgibacillus siamensis]|uniref:aspartyl-phosphate phosphatase Spo0E family protein n=1 Tax=Virgibacillus siamensis TaxID=480071 RepID=UPI0011156C23|nr:aspartyl-phosphate phosphatase Spo0E family protein [Virgibacillus siamensis]
MARSNFDLSAAVSAKKQEMIELGLKYGLTDERTIKCSQQLDTLLNIHVDGERFCLTG